MTKKSEDLLSERIKKALFFPETISYRAVPHVCRKCGGRVGRAVSGQGPSPGGNPLWRCFNCGEAQTGIEPHCICWCGLKFRGEVVSKYECVPTSLIQMDPRLRDLLSQCGVTEKSGQEVGVVLRDSFRALFTKILEEEAEREVIIDNTEPTESKTKSSRSKIPK